MSVLKRTGRASAEFPKTLPGELMIGVPLSVVLAGGVLAFAGINMGVLKIGLTEMKVRNRLSAWKANFDESIDVLLD